MKQNSEITLGKCHFAGDKIITTQDIIGHFLKRHYKKFQPN